MCNGVHLKMAMNLLLITVNGNCKTYIWFSVIKIFKCFNNSLCMQMPLELLVLLRVYEYENRCYLTKTPDIVQGGGLNDDS